MSGRVCATKPVCIKNLGANAGCASLYSVFFILFLLNAGVKCESVCSDIECSRNVLLKRGSVIVDLNPAKQFNHTSFIHPGDSSGFINVL